MVYKAEVTTTQDRPVTKVYLGSTKRTFKTRYKEHIASFKKNQAGTKLTKYIHELKSKGHDYKIKWMIINQSRQSSPSIKFCALCNIERLEIARAEKRSLLNSRNELVTQCIHNPKLFFSNNNQIDQENTGGEKT